MSRNKWEWEGEQSIISFFSDPSSQRAFINRAFIISSVQGMNILTTTKIEDIRILQKICPYIHKRQVNRADLMSSYKWTKNFLMGERDSSRDLELES